ncbi:MAG TPA: enoyl-CoA hydratase/isomerase family protein [Ilumatobacteraceae bacterium]|jgi:enoyl-CoA hydratase/carnithine racemase
MSDSPILYDASDRMALIQLNRPEAGNALNRELITALGDALDQAEHDAAVRSVVITGVGDTFCAGGDLRTLGPIDSYDTRMVRGRQMLQTNAAFRRIEAMPKPVIAAVNGPARAGGLELILCCDLVVAARSATISEGHSTHGQLPGAGGSIRLPRKIGTTRAKYMLFTGDAFAAQTMMDWGLVNEVVDDAGLMDAVRRLAGELAHKSPISLRWMKQLVDDGLGQPLDSALRLEILAAELNLGSEDMAEGMEAIRGGRAPVFPDAQF